MQTSTPWKDPRTGVFYLYKELPERLRAEMGRRQVRRSLRTRDPAEARRLFAFALAELEREMAEAEERLRARAASDEISPERAAADVDRWLRTQAEGAHARWPSLAATWWLEDVADRLLGIGGYCVAPPSPQAGAERWAELRGHPLVGERWLALVRERPRSEWMEAVGMALEPILETSEPRIVPTPGNRSALMDAFNARVVQDVARFRAAVDEPRRAGSRPRLRPDLRFRELLRLWKDERRPRPQSCAEAETAVGDLIDYVGDVAVCTLTSDMLLDYRDEARRLPATMPRADRSLPFRQRVARHASSDAPRVSPTTLKKRVGSVQALLGYAHQQRWIEVNVGSGVAVEGLSRAARTRRSFLDGELAALFSGDLFLRPDLLLERRTAVSDATLFWLFVLGLTSGARLEEVGQARVADVKEDRGIVYVDVDDATGRTSASTLPDKSVKTAGSRRVVPIHDRALELGFRSYVEAVRSTGHELLFPDLKPNSFGKLTKEASRRLNRHLNAKVADDPRLVFHSLRHRFKDEGRAADVQEHVLDQLCGHAPATVGGRYGDGAGLAALKRSLDRLRFEPIDWPALAAATRSFAWEPVAREVVRRATVAETA